MSNAKHVLQCSFFVSFEWSLILELSFKLVFVNSYTFCNSLINKPEMKLDSFPLSKQTPVVQCRPVQIQAGRQHRAP
jgi:hypothetical protein